MVTLFILTTISFFVFFAYTACVIERMDTIPKSYSDTYYQLNRGWLFSVCMVAMAFLLLPVVLELSEKAGLWYTFLGFFTCASLVFVAAAPKFKERDSVIHTVAAIVSAVSGLAWSALTCWVVPVVAVSLVAIPAIYKWSSRTFWAEFAAFLSVYVTTYIMIVIWTAGSC